MISGKFGGIPAQLAVQSPEAYPELTAAGPDPKLVMLLAQNLAYTKGEMTSIYLYLHQNWLLQQKGHILARTLARIAEVEMRHLNLIGQLIVRLGGDPRCQSIQGGRPAFWNGGMVPYSNNLRKMLEHDAAAERDAADLYLSQAGYVKNANAAAVLRRIALDEEIHHQIFLDALRDLGS